MVEGARLQLAQDVLRQNVLVQRHGHSRRGVRVILTVYEQLLLMSRGEARQHACMPSRSKFNPLKRYNEWKAGDKIRERHWDPPES